MKKLISLFLTLILTLTTAITTVFAANGNTDMRAVWVASVYNLDFPSAATRGNAAAQKAEIDSKMQAYKKAGLNSVFLQVRPKGDALYQSALNPWSDVLTGEAGKNPGYDPLRYAIQSAHANGLKLHAWFNPYRVTTSGTDVSVLADGNFAKLHPQWVLTHNNALFLNPEIEEVQNFICETVKEVLVNYDVDGIHFDDYFYPSNYPLTEGNGNGAQANARRQNVNNLVRKVSETVDKYGNGVEFGISPLGVYKNIPGSIKGSQSYYAVYGDTLSWIQNGWVDYITPQVYWETTHATSAYENVVSWWNNQVEGTNVKLYIGEGIYKDVVAAEIGEHLEICHKYENVKGNFFYSSKDLLSNRKGCLDAITNKYNNSAVPPVTKPSKPVDAIPTKSSVLVDGNTVAFEAYNINGYNYFKLRDIAYALNGSEKQFNTVWNEEKQAINLNLNSPYVISGGELMSSGNNGVKKAIVSTAKLYVSNQEISCEAYNIDGNNYYKLRDAAQAVDFGVMWSETLNSIGIVTLVGYTP